MRCSEVIGETRTLVSDLRDFGGRALLNNFKSPDVSMIVESSLEFGGCGITSDNILHEKWCLYCCCVWSNMNLIDYV